MISAEDVQVVEELLNDTPTNLTQDRAIQNIFLTLRHVIGDVRGVSAVALAKFDAMTGHEKIRDMERAFSYTKMGVIERFEVVELLQIRRMWLASEWDFFPDQWTERQLSEALMGKPPRWDDNTCKAVYG